MTQLLLCIKHKTRKMIGTEKMRGESSGVDFFIIKDMIHVDNNKKFEGTKKIYIEDFITQSGKLQRIRRNLAK